MKDFPFEISLHFTSGLLVLFLVSYAFSFLDPSLIFQSISSLILPERVCRKTPDSRAVHRVLCSKIMSLRGHQSDPVRCPTLDFGSRYELRVLTLSPAWGPVLGRESA